MIPALGPEGAAELHRALVLDTLRKVEGLKSKVVRYLYVAGGKIPEGTVPSVFLSRRQTGCDLNQRLESAFAQLLQRHSRAVVIGTDSPAFEPSMLRLALEELRTTDAVLGPCPDGGYYLVGLRRNVKGLFKGARLGTEFALQDTLDSLLGQGFSCSLLETYADIDRPEDLVALRRSLAKISAMRRLMPQTWRFLSGKVEK